MHKAWYTVIGITTALFIVALLWFIGEKPQQGIKPDVDATKAESRVELIVVNAAPSATNKQYSTPKQHDQRVIADSLEGTDIDGALRADSGGNLILDLAVRDFFDYFLSAADELGPELAITEMQRYIKQYLPEPASAEALNLLENYLRFKRAEFSLQQSPLASDTLNDASALELLKTSFAKLKQERRALFTPEQDAALFALEDAHAEHTLASLALMADRNTSDQQKAARLQTLEASLPEALSNNLQISRRQRVQQKNVEAMVNSTQDDAQVFDSLISQGYTQAKADEIISHRQQQLVFESQYLRYQNAKAALDTDDPAFNQSLTHLRSKYFTSAEAQTQAKLKDLQDLGQN